MDSAKTLWYWNRQTPVLNQIATAAQMNINGFTLPANAVYFQDAFLFIKEGGGASTTQTLIQIKLTYGGGVAPVYSATNVRSVLFFLVEVEEKKRKEKKLTLSISSGKKTPSAQTDLHV